MRTQKHAARQPLWTYLNCTEHGMKHTPLKIPQIMWIFGRQLIIGQLRTNLNNSIGLFYPVRIIITIYMQSKNIAILSFYRIRPASILKHLEAICKYFSNYDRKTNRQENDGKCVKHDCQKCRRIKIRCTDLVFTNFLDKRFLSSRKCGKST